jgi:hypothetical protein
LGFSVAVGSRAFVAALMSAGGVGGEGADESVAAEDRDVVTVADAVAFVSGPPECDVDAVGRHVQVAAHLVDNVA